MSAVAKKKYTRDYSNGKRPHQGELDKCDPGLIGRNYATRLDDKFNTQYLKACAYERALYNLRNPVLANE